MEIDAPERLLPPGLTPATAAIEKEKRALGLTKTSTNIPVRVAPTRSRLPLPQRCHRGSATKSIAVERMWHAR